MHCELNHGWIPLKAAHSWLRKKRLDPSVTRLQDRMHRKSFLGIIVCIFSTNQNLICAVMGWPLIIWSVVIWEWMRRKRSIMHARLCTFIFFCIIQRRFHQCYVGPLVVLSGSSSRTSCRRCNSCGSLTGSSFSAIWLACPSYQGPVVL